MVNLSDLGAIGENFDAKLKTLESKDLLTQHALNEVHAAKRGDRMNDVQIAFCSAVRRELKARGFSSYWTMFGKMTV